MEIKDKELHRISITAIIYNDQGKYLVTQRSLQKKAFPGKWTVPGGGLEVGDYMESKPNKDGQWYNAVLSTLRREVKEEVNLEIDKPEYLLDIAFIRPDGIPVIILSYFAKYKSGDVALDKDSTAYKWVTLDEAKKTDLIDGIFDEIKMVDDIIKKR